MFYSEIKMGIGRSKSTEEKRIFCDILRNRILCAAVTCHVIPRNAVGIKVVTRLHVENH